MQRAGRDWVLLEPTIFLFLVAARMAYFTRQNLFIELYCMRVGNRLVGQR